VTTPKTSGSLVNVSVTPRFELFYALFALTTPQNIYGAWKRAAGGQLGKDFNSLAERVAPSPFVWPLLADALRNERLQPEPSEIADHFRSMDDAEFQRDVLGGLFKSRGTAAALIEGSVTLRQAVRSETTGARMLEVVGLRPFRVSSGIGASVQRIIAHPEAYRRDIADAIDIFAERIFAELWEALEPAFERRAARMLDAIEDRSLNSFLRGAELPITIDDRSRLVSGVNGLLRIPFAKLKTIEIFPSAFNSAHFWAAYERSDGRTTLYFPVLHPEQIPIPGVVIDRQRATTRVRSTGRKKTDNARKETSEIPAEKAELAFRALGDKTRFAMAVMLARSPQTSVELARAFSVSKPTISHHVQFFRAAGLLKEEPAAEGVVLRIDRAILESLSAAAAKTMFDGTGEATIQRTRTR